MKKFKQIKKEKSPKYKTNLQLLMLIAVFSLLISFVVLNPYGKHYYYVDISKQVRVAAKIYGKFVRVAYASSL